jgi:hypothetical protein
MVDPRQLERPCPSGGASAYQDSLGADTIKRIDELAEGLYERVAAIALAPSSSR